MSGGDGEGHNQKTLQSRMLWFRGDHPDAEIESELVVAEEEMAVCKVTLRSQTGGSASSHGSALRQLAGARYVELAEDRALTRALIALGYGDVAAEAEADENDESSPPLPPIELMKARSLVPEEPETEETEEYEERPSRPQQIREDRPAREAAGDDGADVNWTKFWTWARRRGYRDANQLSELLGVDVLAHTPREVRQMLAQYELDHPPGGEDE